MIEARLGNNHTQPGKTEITITERDNTGKYIRCLGNAYYPYVKVISTDGANVNYSYLIFGLNSKNGKNILGDFNVDTVIDAR